MFGKLFGRKPKAPPANATAPDPQPGPQMGMLMMRSPQLDPAAVVRAWAELFPNVPPLSFKPPSEDEPDEHDVHEFQTDLESVMLAVMPIPIPVPEIEEAMQASWMLKTPEDVRQQRAHAIAMATGDSTPVESALRVSRLLAAAAKATDAVGIYWGNSGQVHNPALFIDAVSSFGDGETLPTIMWVGIRISADGPKGPFTLTTQGLNPFGHKEFEVIDSKRGFGELRLTVLELANYVLTKGPILKHGNTFGSSAAERIRVEHTTSQFREGEPVIRLHM